MSFNTEGQTKLCCTKVKESVILLILLCLGTKKLNWKNSELRLEVKKIWNLSQALFVPVEKIEKPAEEIRCKE